MTAGLGEHQGGHLPALPMPQFPHRQNGAAELPQVAAVSVGAVFGSPVAKAPRKPRPGSHDARSLSPALIPALLSLSRSVDPPQTAAFPAAPAVCTQHDIALQFTFCSSDEFIPALESLFGLQVTPSPMCLHAAPSLLCAALLCPGSASHCSSSPLGFFLVTGIYTTWFDAARLCQSPAFSSACSTLLVLFFFFPPHSPYVICCNLVF